MPLRRAEIVAYFVLAAAALALRLIDLADRPFQYDESQVAYFSWVFLETGDYRYQPVLHGPVIYYLSALTFALLGDGDFTARLPFALAGVAMVLMPAGLRPIVGRPSALAAAALFAVSPSFLYYSRFAREDIVIAAITLALIVVGARMFHRPRAWHPAALGALLALSFATKESTFITVAIAGAALIYALVRRLGVPARLGAIGWRAWAGGVAAFAFVYALLFSVFFTNLGGIWDGIYEGPRYWIDQHDVNRGGEEWPLYVTMLGGYEWLIVALAIAGGAVGVRRRAPFALFLTWASIASLAIYSYAGERFAWLVLHPLTPMVLLAGIGVGALATGTARPRTRRMALALAAVLIVATTYTAVRTSFARATDPRELMVVVHTDPALLEVLDRVRASKGSVPTIAVDSSHHSQHPWAWYLRDRELGFVDMSLPSYQPKGDVLLVSGPSRDQLGDFLAGYDGYRFTQRAWWTRDYGKLTPAAGWRWLTQREPFGELGSLDQWLFVKRDPAR